LEEFDYAGILRRRRGEELAQCARHLAQCATCRASRFRGGKQHCDILVNRNNCQPTLSVLKLDPLRTDTPEL